MTDYQPETAAPDFVYPATPPKDRTDLPETGPGAVPPFWLRISARLIDSLILMLPLLAITLPYLDLLDADNPMKNVPGWVQIATVVAPVVYEFVFLVIAGATPGKMMVGLRVVSYVGGGRLAVHQAGMRVLLPNLGSLLGLSGIATGVASVLALLQPVVYFSSVLDPVQRGLHDKGAGTIVLRNR